MARDYGAIKTSIWTDPDFHTLTPPAQHLYLALLCHPTLTLAGVLDWRPGRLSNISATLTPTDIEHTAHELETRGYLIIDRDSEEAFIRSFHRNDGSMKQPNLGTGIANALTEVSSHTLHAHIAAELWRLHADHPRLKGFASGALREYMNQRPLIVNNPQNDPHDEGHDDPPVKGQPDPHAEGHDNPHDDPPIEAHDDPCAEPRTMNHEPRTENQKISAMTPPGPGPRDPQGHDRHDPADRFDEFWDLVPVGRKVKRPKAVTAFRAAVKRAGDPQIVIDGMRRYASDPNLPDPRGPEARFILHPTTWLNNDGWNDPPLPPRNAGRQQPSQRETIADWGASPEAADYFGLPWGDTPTDTANYVDAEIVDITDRSIAS